VTGESDPREVEALVTQEAEGERGGRLATLSLTIGCCGQHF
jgi:hypothetical protein